MDEKDFYIQSLNLRLSQERQMASQTIERLRGVYKELEASRLEAHNRRFDKLIHRMVKGVIVCSMDWVVLEANPAAEKYLNDSHLVGLNALDIIFRNYSSAVSRKTLEGVDFSSRIFDILREETPAFGELYLELTVDIIKADMEEDSRIIISFYDVTALRREEWLKQNFLDLMSHKLLTPVSVITVNAAIFKDGLLGALSDKQSTAISNIMEKANSLKSLIEKLFGFTGILGGRIDRPKETIEISIHLARLINDLVKDIKDKPVDSAVEIPDKDLKVNINLKYFYLIIQNLVENAVKFNDKPELKITVSARASGADAEFIIADNGKGIPAEEREKVFERFYQVEKDFTGNVPGVGLGLAIVKKLIEAHGGHIRIESEIGKGAKVIFSLPLAG